MLKCQRPKLPRQGAVKVHDDGREVCDLDTTKGRAIYRERMVEMWERQRRYCPMCRLFIVEGERSFDHEGGRGYGGAIRDDRIWIDGDPQNACLHMRCNGLKGSKRYRWVNGVYRQVEKFKEKAA